MGPEKSPKKGKKAMEKDAATHFAPAGRDTDEELRRRQDIVRRAPLLQATIDAMAHVVLILNERRQVVAVNRCFACLLESQAVKPLGQRMGELFDCIHAGDGPDGCGTDWHCATCGAAQAVLESGKLRGQVTRECRMTAKTREGFAAMDLRVTATLVEVDKERFTICSIEDVSSEKRRHVLERAFFHDVLNIAGGIQGYAQVLEEGFSTRESAREDLRRLAELTGRLAEEVKAQRDLWYAERGDLVVQPQRVPPRALLEELCGLYAAHQVGAGRHLALGEVWEGEIVSDRRLLARVLGNLVKNALEASQPGETVTLQCLDHETEVQFSVHNPAVMPPDVQLQLFERSFSTKGEPGRGIGTHAAKLFGERYLGGKIAFTSRAPEGTTFTFRVPKLPAVEPRQ